MTSLPHPSQLPLRLTHVDGPDTARFELHGDLDHFWADVLQEAVERVLAERGGLLDVYLHCAGLTAVDSSGLSALLMIRRRTGAAGVRLHLEDRPSRMDRLLELTGTLDYLTTPEAEAQGTVATSTQRSVGAEEPISIRSDTTDG
ncbi:STAS domain-containing protein [Streptomyces sp. NPDC090127]|uniref:STAS domain-containing protein n=1 Tax=Streptomyces sp. NPDC090127 TaxID=3365953 RepID=UPI0038029921